MAEKEQLAQELMKISMEKDGELTAEMEKKIPLSGQSLSEFGPRATLWN